MDLPQIAVGGFLQKSDGTLGPGFQDDFVANFIGDAGAVLALAAAHEPAADDGDAVADAVNFALRSRGADDHQIANDVRKILHVLSGVDEN